MEGLTEPLTASTVQSYVDAIEGDSFGTILADIQSRLGRQLPREEKGFIAAALLSRRMKAAAVARESDSLLSNVSPDASVSSGNVLLVTAYSDDYTIGSLCEKVNRRYAERHGHEFISEVLPLKVLSDAIAPKKHCAWYKILLMKKLLADLPYLESKRIQYIAWIDADAIVVDQSIQLTDIIEKCGGRDLIIAEDMNTGCLINTGVFLLRTTGWSRDFINDVWDCVKYNEVTFYEQSTMMRILRMRKENLESVTPFHSYLPNAAQGIKLFPHTAVLPLAEFNSNRGILCNDIKNYEAHVLSLQSRRGEAEFVSQHSATNSNRDTTSCSSSNACDAAPAAKDPAHACDTAGKSSRTGENKKPTVPNQCYQASGNFCTLCQRTVGSNLKRAVSVAANYDPSLFVFHPAGMPDKLHLLYTALHKFKVPYDLDGDVLRAGAASEAEELSGAAPAPLRLVRGKMGQIPQADQSHLLSRMNLQD